MNSGNKKTDIVAHIGTGIVVEENCVISIDPEVHGSYLYYILCVEKDDKGKLLIVRVMGATDIIDMARECTEGTAYVIWYSPAAMALLSPVEDTITTTLANIGAGAASEDISNV